MALGTSGAGAVTAPNSSFAGVDLTLALFTVGTLASSERRANSAATLPHGASIRIRQATARCTQFKANPPRINSMSVGW